ncbi:MAG TPA: ISNCY family transposase [Methylomirabilota bacterium]|nr:ISNCY family transposase [Methylomirabilota bacterium]
MGDTHDESEGGAADWVAHRPRGGPGDRARGGYGLGRDGAAGVRLKRRFESAGAAGLLHRSRGRPSPRRLAPRLRERVTTLLTTTYRDFNDCHATEKLQEAEGLAISRPTVRRLRQALGRPAKHRRRPRRYHAWREPRARMGALVQLDASPFAWLEERGPAMRLHGAIDDTTGTVLALHFRPTEDLHGYTTALAGQYGLPLAFYGDRLNVFLRNDPHWTLAEQLRGAQDPTHLGRMLQALGIGFIPAGSPQAKGRIERLWQTLQDRLVSELRLQGNVTPEAANAFLPAFRADHNRRFARPPARPQPARRPPRGSCRCSSATATTAAWPPTTPCASGCAGCDCRRVRGGGAGLACASSSGNSSTAGSSCFTMRACWPPCPVQAPPSSCGRAATSAPRPGAPVPLSPARRRGAALGGAGDTRRCRLRRTRRPRPRARSRARRGRILDARASRAAVTSSTGPGKGDIFTGQRHGPRLV